MMLTTLPFVAAWVIYYYATTAGMLFIALAMTGLTGGLLEAPVMTYVAEVTQPHLRGMLSATSTMSIILGIFTQMLGGKLGNWRTVTLVNLIYPLICFLALCAVPESPYWLAGKFSYLMFFHHCIILIKLLSIKLLSINVCTQFDE